MRSGRDRTGDQKAATAKQNSCLDEGQHTTQVLFAHRFAR